MSCKTLIAIQIEKSYAIKVDPKSEMILLFEYRQTFSLLLIDLSEVGAWTHLVLIFGPLAKKYVAH